MIDRHFFRRAVCCSNMRSLGFTNYREFRDDEKMKKDVFRYSSFQQYFYQAFEEMVRACIAYCQRIARMKWNCKQRPHEPHLGYVFVDVLCFYKYPVSSVAHSSEPIIIPLHSTRVDNYTRWLSQPLATQRHYHNMHSLHFILG